MYKHLATAEGGVSQGAATYQGPLAEGIDRGVGRKYLLAPKLFEEIQFCFLDVRSMASTNCGNVRFSEIELEKGCFSANDQGGEQACQAA